MTPQERRDAVQSMGARGDWWQRRVEPIVEPDWEVVDAHVHLWDARDLPDPSGAPVPLRTSRYLLDEFLRDAGSGHRVAACVYVECGSGYDCEAPQFLRPVGETRFASALAAEASGRAAVPRIAGIVAHADLRDPDLGLVLDAHARAGGGRLRGIRHSAARLEDPSARLLAGSAPPGLYGDPAFRRGVARLGERGLTFDAFQFHFQVEELVALARAVPSTTMIVNHLGTPVGCAPGSADEDPVFADWARGIARLAALPNLVIKLGGLASIVTGYDGHRRERPPASQDFVDQRGAYFRHAIGCFGAERCLFESNFPVDSVGIGYAVLWNAYKILAGEHSAAERQALLAGTARRVYRL